MRTFTLDLHNIRLRYEYETGGLQILSSSQWLPSSVWQNHAGLGGSVVCGFLLSVYLLPVSFSLRIIVWDIDKMERRMRYL